MTHFIHYLHRQVLLPGQSRMASRRFAAPEGDATSFEAPTRHVLPDQPIVRTIVAGDTVWMISQMSLRRAGKTAWLPVALDARIQVDSPPTLEGDLRVIMPASGSRWFPLADATSLLSELQSIRQRGIPANLGIGSTPAVGRFFQGMRRLSNAEPLVHWASRLAAAPVEFLSYRQIDGTAAAFDVASARLSAGAALFWDRWSLPRSLSERREHAPDGPLDASLFGALDQACCVWGVETPRYYEAGSYSAREATRAVELRTFKPSMHSLSNSESSILGFARAKALARSRHRI